MTAEDYKDHSLDNPEFKPQCQIFRGDNLYAEATQFLPKDLIHLFVLNTGISKAVSVTMVDSRGDSRYHAYSGGVDHKFTTRLQNTRIYGDWYFEIKGTYHTSEEDFECKIPFHLVDKITEVVPEPPVDVVDVLDEDLVDETQKELKAAVAPIKKALESPASADEEPVAEEPVDEEPVAEEPVAEEPVAEEPVAEEPVAEEPVEEEPVEEEPVEEEPVEEEMPRLVPKIKTVENIEYPEITGTIDVYGPTSQVYGIGPKIAGLLESVGCYDVLTLAKADIPDLASRLDTSLKNVTKWVHRAQMDVYGFILETAGEKVEPGNEMQVDLADIPENERLNLIQGIGEKAEQMLNNAGISRISELAKADVKYLMDHVLVARSRAEQWINDASDIVTKNE